MKTLDDILWDAGTGAFYNKPHRMFLEISNALAERGEDFRAMLWLYENFSKIRESMDQALEAGYGLDALKDVGITPSTYPRP